MTSDIFNERETRARTECYELVKFRDRARMLTFIMRDDSRHSSSYSDLVGADYFGRSVRIEFGCNTTVVEGENLAPIHRALTDHRVIFLREAPDGFQREEGESFVKRISILSKVDRTKKRDEPED